MMASIWKTLTRRKVIHQPEESSLGRVLNTYDLTFLGIGATLGVGLYILVGKVAKETAGPSIILSFLIAAIASGFAGLCYAEFGSRVPRAGSAYVYSYVCVGEFIAFVIGWNLILEYVIGSASVAHGMSLYIDAIANDSMKNKFMEIAPIHVTFLSKYFDFFAFAFSILFSICLAFGVKESTMLNNIITCLNIAVVLFVIIAGATKADLKNWKLEVPDYVDNAGEGGFFPFGVTGMIKGAATCFYGFVGFDCIATTGEEARNPRRAIPVAIIVSLIISFLAYFGTSAVVTLMVPYYLQDINAPIPHAFDMFNMETGKWVASIGGCFALFASLFGAMFPLPRIIYAMANDGIIFRFLGIVNSRFSTPVIGTLLAGVLTGLLAATFDQGQLVNMMSIGTLLAYTIVAACVLILRYSIDSMSLHSSHTASTVEVYSDDLNIDSEKMTNTYDEETTVTSFNLDNRNWFTYFFNMGSMQQPSQGSEKLVMIEVFVYCILCILFGLCVKFFLEDIGRGEIYAIIVTSIIAFFMILTLISMGTQPKSMRHLTFKVPLVPLIPAISILVNIYLMMSLDVSTWIRFGIWMAIGLPMYFCSACSLCSNDVQTTAIRLGCGKSRNMSEGSTYVNFGYLNGDPESFNHAQHPQLSKFVTHTAKNDSQRGDHNKNSVDSDSGAYFDENDVNDNEQEQEIESKSIRDVLGSLDNMLEKEEEKCVDFVNIGLLGSRNRSVSVVSSVSTNSNYIGVEESVVAIIHREDEREVILEQPEQELEQSQDDDDDVYQKKPADKAQEVEQNVVLQEHEAEMLNGVGQNPEDLREVSAEDVLVPLPKYLETLETPDSENQISNQPEVNSLDIAENPPTFIEILNNSAKESEINEEIKTQTLPALPLPLLDPESSLPPPVLDLIALARPPPPPPPSMLEFETYKSIKLPKTELTDMRKALKKSKRPITPPPTPTSIRSSKSTRSLFTSNEDNYTEDNLKLTSDVGKQFRSKLEMDLGVPPKNLKFAVLPAPNYYSLDGKLGKNREQDSAGHKKVASINNLGSNLSIADSEETNVNDDGVIDESLSSIDKDDIKQRLTKLFTIGWEDLANGGIKTKNTNKHPGHDFGETKA